MSDGFLSRWSRRKQALARGEEVVEPPPPPEPDVLAEPVAPAPPALAEAAPVTPPEPEPELDLSSLPDIETLDAATDIRAFFQKGVPEALRNAALRKAYATDPVISSYMGPLDYAWDFNTPGGLPYGFASELGEVGEKLRQLIAQAVGEPPQVEAASPEIPPNTSTPSAPFLAEMTPAGEQGNEGQDEAELPPPEAPVRLAGAVEEAAAVEELAPAAASDSELPAPRRRHGGAMPV